jgi:phosphonate degradation associated HDIG domain protein
MSNQPVGRETVVGFLLDLFERRGAEEYMGERVSMARHMEQSAACAVADGAPDELIVAALLHDIGHFIGEFPIDALENGIDNLHEEVGAAFLQRYYPAAVSEPIRLHVAAKQYLCATDATYIDTLSAASVNSLRVQGGPMDKAQISEFEANAHHQDAVRVRRYDDDGKVAGLDIKPVASYRDKLESLLL